MTVLITGNRGFIGSHLQNWFVDRGLNAHGADPRVPPMDLDYLLQHYNHEAIFHLGAISDTTCEDENALEATNVDLSGDLADLCQRRDIPFIYASSASVYGNGLGPLNAYASSKLRFDSWIQYAGLTTRWYGLRFFNVYGPGEDHKGAQASMVHQLLNGRYTMFAPNAQRDFIHVDDVVSVMLWMWKNLPASGIYDVGTGRARSFEEVADICHVDVEWTDIPADLAPKYQTFTQADLTKLRAAGYTERFMTLEEGVAKLISSRKVSRQLDRVK